MRDVRLFIKLTVYYACILLALAIGYLAVPDLQSYLPLGTVEHLIDGGGNTGFSDLQKRVIRASNVTTEFGSLVWFIVAILGAVLLMVPVSWTYLAIRDRDKLDQALLESIIILPVAVTGIVLVVHNSLALAFSLAGVVAGVRFRHTLKSTADSLFIFMAVGVGLAAGIGQLIIALVMTVIFNYVFLLLWSLDYGNRGTTKHYMRPAHRRTDEPPDPRDPV